MEHKVVDNREEQRIEREAEKWVKEFYNVSNYQPVLKEVRKESYIAGATKEAERNKEDAIGFAEWISNNQFTTYNDVWTSTKIHYAPDKYTLEQVYDIYEKWKTKRHLNQKV